MKIISRLFALVLAVVVIVFTVNNTPMATVDFWPLRQVELPVWAIAWIGITFGLVCGFVIAWFSFGKLRSRNRDLVRRIDSDRREIAILRKQVEKAGAKKEQNAALALPRADAA